MKLVRALQDSLSLGGTYRARNQSERLCKLRDQYSSLRLDIARANHELASAITHLNKKASISRRTLKLAMTILDPIGESGTSTKPYIGDHRTVQPMAGGVGTSDEGDRGNLATVFGAGGGALSSAAVWSAVQVIGHASTGAAIVGLQGAAAANAGWAWLGGGSLAAGGGGMAVGHLVLPGVGTAVAVAISTTMSHRRANQLARLCEEVKTVNDTNAAKLSTVQSDLRTVREMIVTITAENEVLADTVSLARRRLFTFGFISRLFRRLRFWMGWPYYHQQEKATLVALDAAVIRFLSALPHNSGSNPVEGQN